MSHWVVLHLIAAVLLGAVWLFRLIYVGLILGRREVLASFTYDGPPADGPIVSIIVAAKDEERNIEACVRSLLTQDYPRFEVIAVDDRSSDRTGSILRQIEREQPDRLRVVRVTDLAPGWFGKNNAMREGVAVSRGDWLLFTDADCRQTSRRTVSMAMREAFAHEVDFLSVTPVLETRAWWERVFQPVCVLVLMIWFLPHHVNKPKRKTAYANGAFMLMRRSCYDAIGGHERVRTEVNEDIHFARLTKQTGLRLRVVENDDLYVTRMYETLGSAWRGWSRILYGCLGTIPRLLAAAGLLFTVSVLPWIGLILAAAALPSAGGPDVVWWERLLLLWAAVIVLMQFVVWRTYRAMHLAPAWSLTYALGSVATLGVLGSAAWKAAGAGRTTWRGTVYRGRAVDTGQMGDTMKPSCDPPPLSDEHPARA